LIVQKKKKCTSSYFAAIYYIVYHTIKSKTHLEEKLGITT